MGVVDVGEHAEVVGHPESYEVGETVALEPLSVAGEEVETELVHVLNHPLGALAIAVVPCAMTTTLLWPEIYHLAREVEWVGHCGGETEGYAHHHKLAIVVAEVLVHPKEEELVLHPSIYSAVACPEDIGTRPYRESSLE